MPSNKLSIKLNNDTAFLKWIAMASMLIDHMGSALFPQYAWMRLVGRIAFPIYAYCVAVGVTYTHSPLKYALRLFVMMLISQPIYVLAMRHTSSAMDALVVNPMPVANMLKWYLYSFGAANIMAALLLGVLLLWSLRERKFIATAALVAVTLYLSPYLAYSYGWKGVLLMVLFYAFRDKPLTSLCWVGGFMLWWGLGGGGYSLFGIRFSLQTFALLALPFIYLPMQTGIKTPKWVFYLFYPAHLAAIYLVQML